MGARSAPGPSTGTGRSRLASGRGGDPPSGDPAVPAARTARRDPTARRRPVGAHRRLPRRPRPLVPGDRRSGGGGRRRPARRAVRPVVDRRRVRPRPPGRRREPRHGAVAASDPRATGDPPDAIADRAGGRRGPVDGARGAGARVRRVVAGGTLRRHTPDHRRTGLRRAADRTATDRPGDRGTTVPQAVRRYRPARLLRGETRRGQGRPARHVRLTHGPRRRRLPRHRGPSLRKGIHRRGQGVGRRSA